MIRLFAITQPEFWLGESEAIVRLLTEGGYDRVHVRKPGCSERDIETLLSAVPVRLRSRLSLHDCHEMALRFGTGVHLNSRNQVLPPGFKGVLSRSCHLLKELGDIDAFDYVFFSPVFESVSKKGYMPRYTVDELRRSNLVTHKVIALGGVRPEVLQLLENLGFGGAAMLGCVEWR